MYTREEVQKLTNQDNIDLPTTTPVQTLLDGLSVEVKQDGEGWKVIPGDIAVVGVKEVSAFTFSYVFPADISRLRTGGSSTLIE